MEFTDADARKWALYVGAGLLVLAIFSYLFFSEPRDFQAPNLVRIERGASLNAAAAQLSDERVIRFPRIFQGLVWLTTGDASIKAGEYYFEKPLTLAHVWYRLTQGVYGVDSIKVTIPEGWTVHQMGVEFEKRKLFSRADWEKYATAFEGYLFPDTYFFLPNATPESVVRTMRENFDRKLNADLAREIASQKRSLADVVIMASLVEKEANGGMTDAPVIAGILWKRIKEGIGLQVDAALTYVTGRASLELRQSDLASDSLYNTYKHRGLPPTPISNPGLDAILAAVHPQTSPYLFYLHGSDGKAHYAATFEEHILNKEKYLK